MMLEAVLKGWANAQAELLPAEGPCKIANYDPTPDQDADELGEPDGPKAMQPENARRLRQGLRFRSHAA